MPDSNIISSQKERVLADGFCYPETQCDRDLIEQLSRLGHQHVHNIRKTLGDKEIGIGSARGYHEIVQRSPGRWDIPMSPTQLKIDEYDQHWMDLVRALLGPDAQFTFAGIVISEPNQPAQNWHIDSPHESKEHRGPHAINVLLALHDISRSMGPTEVAVGSHRLTNHLKYPALVREELIYQHETTTPERLAETSSQAVPARHTQEMRSGSCLVFDDRLLHRGGANHSSSDRSYAYLGYCRNTYVGTTHFEAERSVNDPT